MNTAIQSINAWQSGDKEQAYLLYLSDEGSENMGFNEFCSRFAAIIELHVKNEEQAEASQRFNLD